MSLPILNPTFVPLPYLRDRHTGVVYFVSWLGLSIEMQRHFAKVWT